MLSVAGILEERGVISREISDAIGDYCVANGDYQKAVKDNESQRVFNLGTKSQGKLINQPRYFKKIESIVNTHIRPYAESSSWCSILADEKRSNKVIARKRAKAANR